MLAICSYFIIGGYYFAAAILGLGVALMLIGGGMNFLAVKFNGGIMPVIVKEKDTQHLMNHKEYFAYLMSKKKYSASGTSVRFAILCDRFNRIKDRGDGVINLTSHSIGDFLIYLGILGSFVGFFAFIAS